MSEYKELIGKRVRCTNDKPVPGYFIFGIKESECYTVDDVFCCPKCNRTYFILNETEVPASVEKICTFWEKSPLHAFGVRRFRPVGFEIISNLEIISEMIQERIDFPEVIPEKTGKIDN